MAVRRDGGVTAAAACNGRACTNTNDPQYQAAVAAIARERPKVSRLASIQAELFAAGHQDCWNRASDEEAACELLNIWRNPDPVAYARQQGWLSGGGGGDGLPPIPPELRQWWEYVKGNSMLAGVLASAAVLLFLMPPRGRRY